VTPALTVALALAIGIIAQSLARHLRIPGIVILLGSGAILGPDILNIVRPDGLGEALTVLVEFAVAVVLFEGGLNLNWKRLRREAATIQLLISLGAVITGAGGAVAAHLILGWGWTMSILLGSLVIVTGPTVITPLLRRIRIDRKLETVLEAEGVFIDAVGAILAVVVLEIALSPSRSSVALGLAGLPTRLIAGALFGLAGGIVIALGLRTRRVVPEGFENVFTLSLALALFQASNALLPETGIVAVIVAGLVVGNVRTTALPELREFKEQLTVLLIGMLFVLLAADVRLADVRGLGVPGLMVVVALMFVVRPLNVIACTLRSGMNLREKAFLSWLAPRGIVAAAVASLFYDRLEHAGISGGVELRALVFLVIAVTVVFQGTTGSWVARWLGVRRPSGRGYTILGANNLGRLIGAILRDAGNEVVFIDARAEAAEDAQKEGFRVIYGNALEERTLLRADLESRKAAVAVLWNDAVNLLFIEKARQYKVPDTFIAVERGHGSIVDDMVNKTGSGVLFGGEIDVELWSIRIRRDIAISERWQWKEPEDSGEKSDEPAPAPTGIPKELKNMMLPVAVRRDESTDLFDHRSKIRDGDVMTWLVLAEREESAHEWLRANGWIPAPTVELKGDSDGAGA
jgi:NhaP-type Na+/H+ or K+/H+ antiporter